MRRFTNFNTPVINGKDFLIILNLFFFKRKTNSISKISSKSSLKNELSAECKSHKNAMSSLKETDPSFYDFLMKNDRELLEFDDSLSEQDDDQGEKENENDEDDDSHELDNPSQSNANSNLEISSDMVKEWVASLSSQRVNFQNLKKILHCFHRIASILDGDNELDLDIGIKNEIMAASLSLASPSFQKLLGSYSKPAKSPKWKKFQKLVRHYIKDVILLLKHGLKSLQITALNTNLPAEESDKVPSKSNAFACFILKNLTAECISYFRCFPKLNFTLLEILSKYWISGSVGSDVGLLALLCLRRLFCNSVDFDKNFFIKSFKRLCLSYYKVATTTSSPQQLAFLESSLVELAEGVSASSAAVDQIYQIAFSHIRLAALSLHKALNESDPLPTKTVLNIKWLCQVKLWSLIVSKLASKSYFKQLVYPIVQICFGSIGYLHLIVFLLF